jgi:hypothetical protein
MVGRKRGSSSQAFSNCKQWERRIAVEAVTRRGTWSEVGRWSEVRAESSKEELQARLKRARSRRARTGESRLFDQV